MRTSLRHLSDSRRNDLTLVVHHIHDAFQDTRASGKVFGLGRKLRRAADLADPEMIVLFGAHANGAVMYATELVGVPEAVIDAVRWRLQRLRAVLEMLH